MVRERGLGDELGFCSWERVGASGLLIWLGSQSRQAWREQKRVARARPPLCVRFCFFAAFWSGGARPFCDNTKAGKKKKRFQVG